MITLGSADLRYLLEQVNIGNDYSKLTSPLDPLGVREVSGQNNNLVGGFVYHSDGTVTWSSGTSLHGDWGQADTDFLRMFATDHPTNGSQYGFTFNPVTMQVVGSGGSPILDQSGEPVIVPASFMTQFMEAATPTPGTSPRTITQLISSSDVDPTSPTYNPAAAAAMGNLGGQPVEVSNTVVGSALTAEIPNPGILGGVPYNEWFVAFGQFFDHGLDFITKGGGYVLIPLSPSDPLYDPAATGQTANTMMLSRAALSNPANDFTIDGNGNAVLKSGVTPLFNNSTGLTIDQSQTYGSHASINVLLRQYDENGNITGKLITNAEDMDPAGAGSAAYTKALHDLATWADMRANAARLGIELIDTDVLDAPMIRADAVGHYSFTAQHTVMYRSDMSIDDMGTDYNAANDPFVRWTQDDADAHRCTDAQIGSVRFCNQAILSDMGNGASPLSPMGQFLPPKPADATGLVEGIDYYDPAKLAEHYVSGDHRVNENVGLTAVHHIFHEEHNIEADAIMLAAVKDAVDSGNLASLNASTGGWLADDITQAGLEGMVAANTTSGQIDYQAIADALTWNGEKVYQAARIVTESEYNHIAIDQYVGSLVVLPEFVSYSADINLDVSLEFSQAVFRLGHSQLTETLKIALPNDTGKPGDPGFVPSEYVEKDLFDAFLNPSLYDANGPAAITLGLLNQQGNEVDEFVTAALQQSLVGVPLDLPALNIARGRDVGLPTLNELRQQIFDGLVQNVQSPSNPGIAPYTSWEDFGGHLRTPESLVNFIAAYGRENDTFHLQSMREDYESGRDADGRLPSEAGYTEPAVTLQDLRANAQVILDAAADAADPLHEAAVMFMRGQGSPTYDPVTHTWNQNDTGGGDQGFWDIDLWIGGLAEQPLFDGPLGTTFTFIMEDFGQRMQDGDRFYYLYRMPVGHHLGDQIIGEQFADLIMRTTGLEHIGDAFGYQSATYYLDGYKNHTDASAGYIDNNYDGTIGVNDQYEVNDYFNSIYEHLPSSVKAFVVANSSFEALGDAPVISDPKGDYSVGTPAGWTLSGTGGVYAPTTQGVSAVIGGAGHMGEHVAWLTPGAVLTQDLGQAIAAGNTYTFTLNLGNRTDQGDADAATFGAKVQLIDATGAVVAERIVTGADVSDGHWLPISFGNIADADALGTLRIRIQNTGSEQVLIDNVHVTVAEPGGSANDGHTVIAGLDGDDYLIAGLGDDYVYGDAGNDVIEGAQGNDHLYGGAGDDWITDYENDDFIGGGDGNDYLNGGPGVLDTLHGNNGNDEVHGGDGIDEVYGDDGDDRLYGEGDTDLMIGGEGSDFMDGGDSVDEMFGGNGNDWMRGGVGDDNVNGGSGNDLLEGGLGPTANDGDRLNGDTPPAALPVIEFNGDGTEGDMDVVSYEEASLKIVASLQDANANGTSSNLLDTYALIEGLVGSGQDDELTGADANGTAGNGINNYLIGGGGNDKLTGLGDDADLATSRIDYIFGDSIIVDNDLYWIGDDRHLVTGHGGIDTMGATGIEQKLEGNKPGWVADGFITNWYGTGETRVVFQDGTLGHILGDNGSDGDADVAVYSGNRNEYDVKHITVNGQEAVRITDLRAPTDANGNPVATDGVDILVGVEVARFADRDLDLTVAPISDIRWNAVTPSGSSLPGGRNVTIANLSSDAPNGDPTTYEKLSGSAVIQVDGNGKVHTPDARNNNSLLDNTAYSIDVKATSGGLSVTETFTIRTGSNSSNTLDSSSANNDVILYGRGGNDLLSGGTQNDTLFGQGGNDVLVGGDGNDVLAGGGDNDTANGGAGDDTIRWDVSGYYVLGFGSTTTDGRDFIDGGDGKDTFVLTSTVDGFLSSNANINETFDVYTRVAAGAMFGSLNAETEIVITRNNSVVAELANIEELVINTGAGSNTVIIHGNFDPSHLLTSTITINGDDGDDTVDISELTSDHRIVFHGAGGNNQVVGSLRPQDVFDNESGPSDPMLPPSPVDQGSGDNGYGDDGETGSDASDPTPTTGGDDPADHDQSDDEGVDGDEQTGSGNPEPTPPTPPTGGHGGDDHGHSGDAGAEDDHVRNGGPSNDYVHGGKGTDTAVFSGDISEYRFGHRGAKVIVADQVAGRDGHDTLSGIKHVQFDDDSYVLRAGDYHGKHVWGSNSKSDLLLGFGGDDILDGGHKADVLVGGAGKDRFVFDDWDTGVGEGARDMILDFKHGQDRLDLKGIDANHARHGDQRFYFKGTHDFTGAQQVRYEHVDTNGDGAADSTLVQGNVNADLGADFEIMLKGYLGPLHAHDILF